MSRTQVDSRFTSGTMIHRHVTDFESWREAARGLLAAGVTPGDVLWGPSAGERSLLDGAGSEPPSVAGSPSTAGRVPREFLQAAEFGACHRDPGRWELLYRLLWRLNRGEPHLLNVATDEDVFRLNRMAASVRRDVHKMKAFVRFRSVAGPDGGETFVAWHRPDHDIVRLAAPFFVRRFGVMTWAILTPDGSAYWDRRTLTFGAGVAPSSRPREDDLEDLWRAYYAATFNPARANPKAMTREMPVRHWPTLPEAALIPELLRESASRVEVMIETTEGFAMSAADFLPPEDDLESLREAAAGCQGCPLYKDATQTVFGKGPAEARVVMVGEVPGDMEDRKGEPFIGPAGKVLDDALRDAGVDRDLVYVTNAVKHFKFKIVGGGRRLHQKPGVREMKACKPWLEAELEAIRPEVVVCLGATAAQSVISPDFRITRQRGEVFSTDYAPVTIATYHPSAILRAPDENARATMYELLVEDLRTAARHLDAVEPAYVNDEE